MVKSGVGRAVPLMLSGLALLVSLVTAGFVAISARPDGGLVRGKATGVASPPVFDGDWARRILFPTQARPDSPHSNHMVSLAYNWDWSRDAGWSRADPDSPSVALTLESWYEGLAELNLDMRPPRDSTPWLGGRVMGFAARHDGTYATLAVGGPMYGSGSAGIKLTGGMTGEALLVLNEGVVARDGVIRVRQGDGRSAVVLRGGMNPSLGFGFAGESADGLREGALRFYGPAAGIPLINAVGVGDATLLASRPKVHDPAPRFRVTADGRLEWDDGSGRPASLAGASGRLDVRGELATTALRVGSEGATLRGLRILALRLEPGPVGAKALDEQVFAAPGLPAEAIVLMSGPPQPPGVALTGARTMRPGEIAVGFVNLADTAERPSAGVYQLVAIEADP